MFMFRDRYPFTSSPYELMIEGWNEDDAYEHTVTFALTVEPLPPLAEISALEMVLMNRRMMQESMRMPQEL